MGIKASSGGGAAESRQSQGIPLWEDYRLEKADRWGTFARWRRLFPMQSTVHSLTKFPLPRLPLLLVVGCGAMLVCRPPARAEEFEAVSSTVSGDYVRAKLSDGSFKSETYSFGDGGRLAGPLRDNSIDQLTFMDVAKVVARPLARRNYVPVASKNPEDTKLLIMVYWGTTRGTAGASDSSNSVASSGAIQKLQASQGSVTTAPPPPAMSYMAHCTCDASQVSTNFASVENGAKQSNINSAFAVVATENRARDEADRWNAQILGYDSALADAGRLQLTAFRSRRDDLVTEIEANRDFVVLQAYDFQTLWKQKKHKLLWVTRLSVRERGTDFAAALPALVSNASQYFGQDSFGLQRKTLPEGRVDIGDVKSLGVVMAK